MKRLLLASAFAALPFAAHAADIEPVDYTWIEDNAPVGQATVTFSLAATYFDMGVTNGFAGGIFGNTLFIRQPDDGFSFDTWGITGDIEGWLPMNISGYFIGGLEGARVEQSKQRTMSMFISESLEPLPIDGGLSLGSIGINDPIDVSANGEHYRVAGLAGWGTDVANGTKIGIGAYLAFSELDLDAAYQNLTFPSAFSQIDETVQTWSGGLAVLGKSRHEVMPGIGIILKGRAAALYAHSELNASQIGNSIGGFSRSAADTAEKFAGVVEGQVGLDLALGPNATMSVFGGAAWRNDVFEIVNPRARPGDDYTSTEFVPAHLDQTDLIEYSAGGKLEFNF